MEQVNEEFFLEFITRKDVCKCEGDPGIREFRDEIEGGIEEMVMFFCEKCNKMAATPRVEYLF